MMKRFLVSLLAVAAMLAAVSCRQPTAGEPTFEGLDFSKYDSFAVMRSSSAKGLSDGVVDGLKALYGIKDELIEKLRILDDKGQEWRCNSVSKIDDYLLLQLESSVENRSKGYIIDRKLNKAIDTEFLCYGGNFGSVRFQSTKDGLFCIRDSAVCRLDLEGETLTSLTNPKTDEVGAYWMDDAGNMLAQCFDPSNVNGYGRIKVFPKDGSIPVEVDKSLFGYGYDRFELDGLRSRKPYAFLGNRETGVIVSPCNGQVFDLSKEGLEKRDVELDDDWGDMWSVIFPYGGGYNDANLLDGYSMKAVIYRPRSYTGPNIIVYDVTSGDVVVEKYSTPLLEKVVYYNGKVVYETSDGGCLYVDELGDGWGDTPTMINTRRVATWKLVANCIYYTEYLSATDSRSYIYNIDTGLTENASSSTVEVLSIASFVK